MTRPREFNPEEALDRAVALFWERGYTETSMDELVKETGVSRYGFYGTFGSKLDLFEKVLDRYAERMSRQMMKPLLKPGAGLAEIEEYFARVPAFVRSMEGRKGCLLCNTAVEVAPHNEKIAAMVRKIYDRVARLFEKALTNAVERGEIRKSKKEIEPLARFLTGMVQGAAVMARTRTPAKEVQMFVDVGLQVLR